MTAAEVKWAYRARVPIRIVDRARGFDIWHDRIRELIAWSDDDGREGLAVKVITKRECSPSALRADISDIVFAKKEDEERCHRELGIQKEQSL